MNNKILYDVLFDHHLEKNNIRFTTDTDILWLNFSIYKKHATGEITAHGFFSGELAAKARGLIAARLLKCP